MAHCLHHKRWFHTKRSAFADRRNIRSGFIATFMLAHTTAHVAFHQTNSTKANHTNSLDGTHLLRQCGKLKFIQNQFCSTLKYIVINILIHA